MKVLLTGVNSFIGRNLGAYLHKKGYAVRGTVRKDKHDSFKPLWLEKSFILDLASPGADSTAGIFEGVDFVIHLAHDFGENMADMNIKATELIAESAEKAGALKQIFFSSYSARPDAISEYGVIKYRLEQYFLKKGHIIVRPGLVIGRGGMFLKLFNAVRKLPVIPLPDKGQGDVPVISMRQLCEVIHKIISTTLPEKEFNIFYPEMTSVKALVDAMKAAAGSNAFIINLPSALLLWTAGMAQAIGIKLPFNIDSLRSFDKNQQRVHQSNIDKMLDKYDSVHDSVAASFSMNIE